jgi:hypothetical protein
MVRMQLEPSCAGGDASCAVFRALAGALGLALKISAFPWNEVIRNRGEQCEERRSRNKSNAEV